MTEPESHTLAYLRRIDEKFDRLEGRLGGVEGRLDRIEDELLVLNGIALRLEGREMETTGLKAMLDRHDHRLGKPGCRVAELEGALKSKQGVRASALPGALLTQRCEQVAPPSSALRIRRPRAPAACS